MMEIKLYIGMFFIGCVVGWSLARMTEAPDGQINGEFFCVKESK